MSWIWYGPAGEEGDVATEIEESGRSGWLDDVDPLTPILKTTTYVDVDDLKKYLAKIGVRHDVDDDTLVRYAVSLGVAQISYYGGDDEFVAELPRP